jgi:hypothetical protein
MEIPAGIFSYKSRSVGTAFHQTCDALGIEDLHFHDLRHEGTITVIPISNWIASTSAISRGFVRKRTVGPIWKWTDGLLSAGKESLLVDGYLDTAILTWPPALVAPKGQ